MALTPADMPDPAAQRLLDAAMTHHRQGEVAEAAVLYRQFLELEPDSGQALRLAGALAREQGDLQQSRALLDRACAAAAQDAAPFNELALTCLAAGELTTAEIALRDALARDANSVRAWANLGALLQYRGRLLAAADCHRKVLALHPEDLEVRCNLATTLLDAGRGEDALAEIEAALARAPGHPALLAAKGAALVTLERPGAAVDCLRLATGRYPEDDMAWTNLGQACRQQGDIPAAIQALEQACRRNPDNARALADVVNLHSATGDAGRALSLAEEFLQRHPGERLVLASQAIALRDAGRTRDADALMDLERLIRVSDDGTPVGFPDQPAFLSALAGAITKDESLLAEPASKATRGGRQTGELDLHAVPALQALGELFDRAVAASAQAWRVACGADHPALAYDSGRWLLRAWGTVLEAGGCQAPHQHPLGFVSGVFYVRVPTDMAAGGRRAGWLEFGQPPSRLVCSQAAPTRAVAPQPGRLVVFPSYFWHRTLPFEAPETRISIAFDAVPLAAGVA